MRPMASRSRRRRWEQADYGPTLDGLLLMSPANPTGVMQSPDSLREIARTGLLAAGESRVHFRRNLSRPDLRSAGADGAGLFRPGRDRQFLLQILLHDGLARRLAGAAASTGLAPSSACSSRWRSRRRPCRRSPPSPPSTRQTNWRRSRPVTAAIATSCWTDCPRSRFDRLAPADGAFYLYADVSRFTYDLPRFCHDLLHHAGIAATPGVDFDPTRGRLALRLSYAGAESGMIEALKRMKAFLSSR